MPDQERRGEHTPTEAALRAGLSEAQLKTLKTMEQFGWTLRFVRKPMFRDPLPVLFDRAGARYVVLERDGTIDEQPNIKVRD